MTLEDDSRPTIERYHEGGQDYNLTQTYRLPEGNFRVSIHRDAYNSQSRATVERYDGTAWQTISRLPGELMSDLPSYANRNTRVKRAMLVSLAERQLEAALESIRPWAK